MRQVFTSIVIDTSPERVWHVLTDFAAYAMWNPFIPAISGQIGVGEKLHVRIVPPGGKPMSFKPVVLVADANRELRWRGRVILPKVFDGEHYFKLSSTKNGTLLEHGEDFSGILTGLLSSSVYYKTKMGFISLNEALKKRAEANS